MSKTIRISFNFDGDSHLKKLSVLPITDDERKKIVKDNDCDANNALQPLYDYICDKDSEQIIDYVFTLSGTPTELYVTDDESDEEVYSDDEYFIEPSRSIMSMEEAEENWSSEDDKGELDDYCNYLTKTENRPNNLLIAKGISKAWSDLANNNASSDTFIPVMMRESMKAAGSKAALLSGESEVCQSTITFKVELSEDEEFDIEKLDFLNVDESYDNYSSIFNNLLEDDIILMNVIIYDGKLFFAGHEQINCGDNEGDEENDFVNEDMESDTPDIEIEEPKKVQKYKSPDEWPKEAHDFIDMWASNHEGSIFASGFIEEQEEIINAAARYEIDVDEFAQFTLAKYKEKSQAYRKKRDRESILSNLQYEFDKKIKGDKNNHLPRYLLEAKTEYKDDIDVQNAVKLIEGAIAKKEQDEKQKKLQTDNEDLHKELYRERVKQEAEKEKLQSEAESIRIKTQMMKDEAEYAKLKAEKDKREAAERELRMQEARKRNEENIRQLKENWPIIKKILIALAIILVVIFTLLLLFGPKL